MSEEKKKRKGKTARLVNKTGRKAHPSNSNSDEQPLHTTKPTHQRPRQQQTRPRKSHLTRPMQRTQPHRPLHLNPHLRRHRNPLPGVQDGKPQNNLQTSDADGHDDQEDDDPGDAGHFLVADAVGQDLAEVEEDLATLVEHLDARFDLEVLADGRVQGVQGGF